MATDGPSTSVTLLTRITLVLSDVIVVLVTWVKMYSQVKDAMRLHLDLKASTIMLSDGKFRVCATRGTLISQPNQAASISCS